MVKRLTKNRPRDSKEFSSTSDNGLKSSELSEKAHDSVKYLSLVLIQDSPTVFWLPAN